MILRLGKVEACFLFYIYKALHDHVCICEIVTKYKPNISAISRQWTSGKWLRGMVPDLCVCFSNVRALFIWWYFDGGLFLFSKEGWKLIFSIVTFPQPYTSLMLSFVYIITLCCLLSSLCICLQVVYCIRMCNTMLELRYVLLLRVYNVGKKLIDFFLLLLKYLIIYNIFLRNNKFCLSDFSVA